MKNTMLIALLGTICLLANAEQTCPDTIAATTPTSRFSINHSDNTVTDTATGLIWQRCSLGQTPAGNQCAGTPARYTWAAALNEVANNHSGWRLPNIKELRSIVERKCYKPAINLAVFPNTPSRGYWSSSPVSIIVFKAWVIDFGYGYDNNYYNKDHIYYVRLVRGGL